MAKHADSKRRDSAQSMVKQARRDKQRERNEITRLNTLNGR